MNFNRRASQPLKSVTLYESIDCGKNELLLRPRPGVNMAAPVRKYCKIGRIL
jgi:hypothetical protein